MIIQFFHYIKKKNNKIVAQEIKKFMTGFTMRE